MPKKTERRKFWIQPHVHCSCDCGTETEEHDEGCADQDDTYQLIYELPGVSKDKISIKVVKNGLRLNAIRDKHVEYVSEYPFLLDVDTTETEAIYKEGLLIVNLPVIGDDPFKKVKPIDIS